MLVLQQTLTTTIVQKKPEDPLQFLADEVTRLKSERNEDSCNEPRNDNEQTLLVV